MSPHRAPRGSSNPSAHLSTDLRIACLRIARRNRHESVIRVAPHQVAVLVCIEAGANSAREIAESEKVSAATISRTIAGLVEMGLVTRSPNEADGRRVDLAITDEGCRVMQETREAREEWMAWRLKHLTEEELQHLEIALPALEKIATL